MSAARSPACARFAARRRAARALRTAARMPGLRVLAAALAFATAPAWAAAASAGAPPVRELAVCADPSNLPFSNDRGEGFENRIATLIADDLHARLRYVWNMQRRGFLRRTLNASACDLVMGVPTGLQGLATSRPYYTSSYVFVSVRSRALHLHDFDDPSLRRLTIGLQAMGAEGANTPPASALALRGIVGNVVGFPMWDTEDVASPPAAIIDAVATGAVDTAIVWGPFAGYFARRHADRLEITPVAPDPRMPAMAFAFDMSLGVRRGDDAFRDEVQAALDRHRDAVQSILRDYGVPLVQSPPGAAVAAAR
jgi:mxaJ protein